MPLLLHEPLYPPGEWGLWRIAEDEEWFRQRLALYPSETESLERIKGVGRRREFLAARHLLHRMSGRNDRGELFKDADGKPHLRDALFHVSISHTVDYAAALAHPNPCGIDVQRIVPRIFQLAEKFVGPAESAQLLPAHELIQLHLLWSAKEAMYKAFGQRKLDFKAHLFVDLGDYSPVGQTATAYLKKDSAEMIFDLTYRVFPDAVLVACVESLPGFAKRGAQGLSTVP